MGEWVDLVGLVEIFIFIGFGVFGLIVVFVFSFFCVNRFRFMGLFVGVVGD